MKAIALFLTATCLVQVSISRSRIPARRQHTADNAYLIKQKNIYELFWHIDQPTVYHPELYQKAQSFNFQDNLASFNNQAAVTEFLQRLEYGIVPRGILFSGDQHYHEAINLFYVFLSAKDFETLYNVAVWARFNVNEYVYIYALMVAVLHHPDTRRIHLPPLYEILPHYFFNEEVIHKAHHIALGNRQSAVNETVGSVNYYYIPANYSDWYIVHDHGVSDYHKLSYFTEDVGLTSFYVASIHDFPHWLSSDTHNLLPFFRGEWYLYLHHQILARYNLERLSNNLIDVEYVDINKPVVPYYPKLQHPNGASFPQRPVGFKIPVNMHEDVQALQDAHVRISDAIASGHIVDANGNPIDIYKTVDGLNQLGNIIQGNADSVNPGYYGQMDSLYRKVFGVTPVHHTTSNNVIPSALDMLSTCLRDPLFYRIHKNIVSYWTKYKQHLPKYTHEELVFPGVHVESVTVDQLVTFFDHFDSLISNAVPVSSHKQAQSTMIKARQNRLNHKPFSYHVTVHSDKYVKAVVRVFIGPKYDVYGREVDISESHYNFFEMDQWVVDLIPGPNELNRCSYEFLYAAPDEVPSDVLYRKVVKALENDELFAYSEQLYGFPDRLLIPKGKKKGLTFKLFVAVSSFSKTLGLYMDSPVWGSNVLDDRWLGYPLDRPIPFNFSKIPNFFMKDVVITHKQGDKLH
ncbi:larval serum protein 1 alpha chain [Camponotus floridanus]|uniref:larval serum protein 1 alpha chain n=1 Tax=Camponotus floridanus TaxID=104421 RepID=UPI000DC6B36B|nr:larval serum protein 1 alpha chain [Camponotus floridanus]